MALYASVALSVAAVLAMVAHLHRPIEVKEDAGRTVADWEGEPAVRLLQQYVRIDTSEKEIDGARFLAEELRKTGLEPELEELGNGHANLWAVIEGQRREAIVLHHHIDVFEAPTDLGWKHPPFEGVIDPPFLYGRGVFDMKSLAIAQLETMRQLAASRRRPERSVIFLATSGEEIGSHLGTRWVLQRHPELVSRFDTVLTEGGIIEPNTTSEIKFWGIEAAQKRYAEGSACADRRDLLEELSRTIRVHQLRYSVPRIVDEVAWFLGDYSKTRDQEIFTELLDRIADGSVEPRRFRRAQPYLRSFVIDEIATFPVEELEDGTFRMRMFLNLLPGSPYRETLDRLLPEWMRAGIEVEFGPPVGSIRGSPIDHPDYRLLERQILREYPGTVVSPFFLAWSATDARFFRDAGVAAYGFSPFVIFNTESFRADNPNERINLPGFVKGIDLYVETVRRMAG